MSDNDQKSKGISSNKIHLRRLEYSPDKNPLVVVEDVRIKQKHVRTGTKSELVDINTGEVSGVSVIHTIQQVDDAHFVKVFSAGVAACFELTRTASRVFQAVLHVYEKSPMSKGYLDSVYLAWFGEGLAGETIGMTERSFRRGLVELLEKGFLAPRSPNLYWVNPSLFFRGNRVLFIREWSRQNGNVIQKEDPQAVERDTAPDHS